MDININQTLTPKDSSNIKIHYKSLILTHSLSDVLISLLISRSGKKISLAGLVVLHVTLLLSYFLKYLSLLPIGIVVYVLQSFNRCCNNFSLLLSLSLSLSHSTCLCNTINMFIILKLKYTKQ